jgi:hypothetical protein
MLHGNGPWIMLAICCRFVVVAHTTTQRWRHDMTPLWMDVLPFAHQQKLPINIIRISADKESYLAAGKIRHNKLRYFPSLKDEISCMHQKWTMTTSDPEEEHTNRAV